MILSLIQVPPKELFIVLFCYSVKCNSILIIYYLDIMLPIKLYKYIAKEGLKPGTMLLTRLFL